MGSDGRDQRAVRARARRRLAGGLRALRPRRATDGGGGGEACERRSDRRPGPGRHYAEQLDVPFVFLSNGDEVWFLDRGADAHARAIATFYSQEDLERRVAASAVRRALSDVPVDRRIVDRRYQVDCVDTLSDEVMRGRRKLLVEMATGTGKTRTAAAFIKRLFEAGAVTRVLFLVDRIALAAQAEDAFTDHLRDYPCHVLRPGSGFDRAKRITIATLQTMIAEYGGLSSGYFDLVITDECHRSIYGKWGGVLWNSAVIRPGPRPVNVHGGRTATVANVHPPLIHATATRPVKTLERKLTCNTLNTRNYGRACELYTRKVVRIKRPPIVSARQLAGLRTVKATRFMASG